MLYHLIVWQILIDRNVITITSHNKPWSKLSSPLRPTIVVGPMVFAIAVSCLPGPTNHSWRVLSRVRLTSDIGIRVLCCLMHHSTRRESSIRRNTTDKWVKSPSPVMLPLIITYRCDLVSLMISSLVSSKHNPEDIHRYKVAYYNYQRPV